MGSGRLPALPRLLRRLQHSQHGLRQASSALHSSAPVHPYHSPGLSRYIVSNRTIFVSSSVIAVGRRPSAAIRYSAPSATRTGTPSAQAMAPADPSPISVTQAVGQYACGHGDETREYARVYGHVHRDAWHPPNHGIAFLDGRYNSDDRGGCLPSAAL